MRLEDFVEGISKTQILYWDDPYRRSFTANILRIELEEKNKVYLILDRTIFHPKGGGQPSDRGRLFGYDHSIDIKKSMMVKEVIIHYGKLLDPDVKQMSITTGEIDWAWRYLLMRRHTAVHLLDHCIATVTDSRVETTDSWLGDKCYVEYSGKEPNVEILQEAFKIGNKMITESSKVFSENVSFNELVKRAPEAPNMSRLPRLNSVRLVTIDNCYPIPCGGTHLHDIREIGNLQFKHVTTVDTRYRIYYDVD